MIRQSYAIERDGGTITLTLEIYEEEGRTICGLYRFEGSVPFPPKRWLRVIREEMQTLERIVREAGCEELRLGGRDWSRILPDYQPLDGIPNGLVKRLR